MAKQISCEAHDYFEIVCMRRSKIRVTLTDQRELSGEAKDIVRHEGKEFLVLVQDSGDVEIKLNDVRTLKALNNPVAQHNFEVVLR